MELLIIPSFRSWKNPSSLVFDELKYGEWSTYPIFMGRWPTTSNVPAAVLHAADIDGLAVVETREGPDGHQIRIKELLSVEWMLSFAVECTRRALADTPWADVSLSLPMSRETIRRWGARSIGLTDDESLELPISEIYPNGGDRPLDFVCNSPHSAQQWASRCANELGKLQEIPAYAKTACARLARFAAKARQANAPTYGEEPEGAELTWQLARVAEFLGPAA